MRSSCDRNSLSIVGLLILVMIFSSPILPGLPYFTHPSSLLSIAKEAAAQEGERGGEEQQTSLDTSKQESKKTETKRQGEEEKEREETAEQESASLQQDAGEQAAASGGDKDDNNAPIANAGPDLTVNEGTMGVILSGKGADADTDDDLTYLWKQIIPQGERQQPEVRLNDVDRPQAKFDAPDNLEQDTTLTFELTVGDSRGEEGKDTVNVFVKNVVVPAVVSGTEEDIATKGEVQGESDEEKTVEVQNSVKQGVQPSAGEAPLAVDSNANGDEDDDDVAAASTTINQPPVADAGDNQTVIVGDTVTLDGRGSSDPDGDPLTYTWTQIDGPAVTLSDASSATPSFTAPSVNTKTNITIQLVVNDEKSNSEPDTTGITISLPSNGGGGDDGSMNNNPPTANPGTYQQVNEGDTVTLDGRGSSDPDGDPLTYTWTQIDGPAVTLSDASSATPSFTAPSGNPFLTFQLVVNDGRLDSQPATVDIGVDPPKDFSIDCVDIPTVIIDSNIDLRCTINSLYRFSAPVDLSCNSSAPISISCSLKPSQVTLLPWESREVTVGIHTAKSALPGTYDIVITGKSGSAEHDNTMSVTMVEGLEPDPFPLEPLPPGGDGSFSISYYLAGYSYSHLKNLNRNGYISLEMHSTAINYHGVLERRMDSTIFNTGFKDGSSETYPVPAPCKHRQVNYYWSTISPQSADYEGRTEDIEFSYRPEDQTVYVRIGHWEGLDCPGISDEVGGRADGSGGFVVSAQKNSDGTVSASGEVSIPLVYYYPACSAWGVELCMSQAVVTVAYDFVLHLEDNNPNLPPIAFAGQDQTVKTGDIVTLDGSTSADPDNDPLTYKWTKTQGPPVTLNGADSSTPTFTAPEVDADGATLTFELIVNDGRIDSLPDTVDVLVEGKEGNNLPPEAKAGEDQIANPGDPVTLDGTASRDPDGDLNGNDLTYEWIQTQGTPVSGFDALSANAKPEFRFPVSENVDEVLRFSLTVKDSKGLESQYDDEVSIIRNHGPDPVVEMKHGTDPVRLAQQNNNVRSNTVIELDASKSIDKDQPFGDKIVSYYWSQSEFDTKDVDLTPSADGKKVTFTMPKTKSTVHINLVLRDSLGIPPTSTIYTFTSKCPPGSIDKEGNCSPIAVGSANVDVVYVVFDGKKSYDPDGGDKIVEYSWTQILDGTAPKVEIRGSKKDPNQYFIPLKADNAVTYQFKLQVRDSRGVESVNDQVVKITIDVCSPANIEKVKEVEEVMKHNIAVLRSQGKMVAAETLELWMNGIGADQFPKEKPRLLGVQWIRQWDEVQDQQNKAHELFEGPHNEGSKGSSAPPEKHLYDFINKIQADGNPYNFPRKEFPRAALWELAIKSSFTDYGDHNIAVGGTQITVVGNFIVIKYPSGQVAVSGQAKYSIMDMFDFNRGTAFAVRDPSSGITYLTAAELNLLEACGKAAPFWSAVTWTQSVVGAGTDLPTSPPKMKYTWRDE